MENIDRASLAQILSKRGGNPLSPGEALIYLKAIVASLSRLHGRGLVHGDIKASNVFQDAQGKIILEGVGFAQQIGSRSVVRPPVETVPHLAPELVSYQVVNEATDVYSLGFLFYEMLTGETPPGGVSTTRTPRQVNPSISAALSQVVMNAMASNPAERFSKPKDFFEAACSALNIPPDQVLDRLTPEAFIQTPPATTTAAATVIVSRPAEQASATVAIPGSTVQAQETLVVPSAVPYRPVQLEDSSPPSDAARRPVWLWIGIGAVGLIVLLCVGFFIGSRLPGLVAGSSATPTATWTATILPGETTVSSPTLASTSIPLPTAPISTATLAPTQAPSPTFTIPPLPTFTSASTGGDLQVRNRFPYPIYVFRDQKSLTSAPIPSGKYLIFFNQPPGTHTYSFCRNSNLNNDCFQKEVTISGDVEITVP